MSAKSKKTELNEELIAIWKEEQSFCDVISPLHQDKNEKDESLKRLRFLIDLDNLEILKFQLFLNGHKITFTSGYPPSYDVTMTSF